MENVKPLSGRKWECQGRRNGYGMEKILPVIIVVWGLEFN